MRPPGVLRTVTRRFRAHRYAVDRSIPAISAASAGETHSLGFGSVVMDRNSTNGEIRRQGGDLLFYTVSYLDWRLLGISDASVSAHERNARGVSLALITAWAAACDVDRTWLA